MLLSFSSMTRTGPLFTEQRDSEEGRKGERERAGKIIPDTLRGMLDVAERDPTLLMAIKVYIGCNKRIKYQSTGERLKLGLSLGEQRQLLAAAKTFYDSPKGAGSQSGLDNERVYQTLYLMIQAGMHRKVIAEPLEQGLEFKGNGLSWFRPKKKGLDAYTVFPLPVEARAWAGGYVEWLRERKGIPWTTINRMVRGVADAAGLQRRKVSPLTLRHTCGVNLARRGVPITEICTLLNCSVQVATQHYLKEAIADVADQHADGVLLKGPGEA